MTDRYNTPTSSGMAIRQGQTNIANTPPIKNTLTNISPKTTEANQTQLKQVSDTEPNMRPESLLYQLPLQEIGNETMEMIVQHNTRQNMLPLTTDTQSTSLHVEPLEHRAASTSTLNMAAREESTGMRTDGTEPQSLTAKTHLEQISMELRREIEKMQLDFAGSEEPGVFKENFTCDTGITQEDSIRLESNVKAVLSPLSYDNLMQVGGSPLSREIIVIDDDEDDDNNNNDNDNHDAEDSDDEDDDDIQIISERRVSTGLQGTLNDLNDYNTQLHFSVANSETRRAISNELRNWNVRTPSITLLPPTQLSKSRTTIQRESLSDLSRRIDENLAANGRSDSTIEKISQLDELSTPLLDTYGELPALQIPTNTEDIPVENWGELTPISAVGPLRLASNSHIIIPGSRDISNNPQMRTTANSARLTIPHNKRKSPEVNALSPPPDGNSFEHQYNPTTRSSSGCSTTYPTSSRYSSVGISSRLSPPITILPQIRNPPENFISTRKLPSITASRTIESQILDGSTLYSKEGLDFYRSSSIPKVLSRTTTNTPRLPVLPSVSLPSGDSSDSDGGIVTKGSKEPIGSHMLGDCGSSNNQASSLTGKITLDPLRTSPREQNCAVVSSPQFDNSEEFQSQLEDELGSAYLAYMSQMGNDVNESSIPITPKKTCKARVGRKGSFGESDWEDKRSAVLFENFDGGSTTSGSPVSISFGKGVSHVSSPFKVVDGIKDAVLNRYVVGSLFGNGDDSNSEGRSEDSGQSTGKGTVKPRRLSFEEIYDEPETLPARSRHNSPAYTDGPISVEEVDHQQQQEQITQQSLRRATIGENPKGVLNSAEGDNNNDSDAELEIAGENTSTSIQPSLVPAVPVSNLPDDGVVFLSINAIKDLGLRDVKEHNAEFSLELRVGNKVKKTFSNLVPTDGTFNLSETVHLELQQEFRQYRSLGFVLKCHYERDTGTQEVEIVEKVPVKQRFPFGKKKYTYKSTFVTQPKPPDPWDRIIKSDGSYGEAVLPLDTVALSKAENKSISTVVNLNNTWSKDRGAHSVGVIGMSLLWIPRNVAEETIPTTLRDVERVAERYKYQQAITKEGYLMQEGADHPGEPCRRYFMLNGTQLIGCHEVTLVPEIDINLLQAENVIYGGSVSGEGGKRNFTNFTNLILLGSNIKLIFRDGEIINLYVESEEVEKNDWFLKLREVVHLNAYHQPWVKKYVAESTE